MMQALVDWVEKRTGAKQLLHEALYENIPSGARWRYITGSMLVFAFVTQAITGIFLWMAYSPSSQTAYESVYFIQYEMTGGWLLRGIHHFMAQAMVVVMGLHLLQVIVDGAYKAPREVNYWLGLVLMQLVMGLGLTGYLLPWDQKGYWATNVATNLMTLVPFVGKEIQMVAVGGSDYGNHTLTRFFAMHAGVLPALLIGFLALHIAAFRKHGITAKITPGRADQYFWPHQVLMDAVGCLVLLGIVFLCAIHFDVGGLVAGNLPAEHRGAELGAPADPSLQYSAARPEWYYLFLFQLLKYFHGTQEVIGALVLPGVAMTILALMPFIGRSNIGHKFNVAFILLLLAGAGVLTVLALNEDAGNQEFQVAKEEAEVNAKRTIELINRRQTNADGTVSEPLLIQREGAVYLLRNDPLTNGPKLFAQHCSSCHSYVDRSVKEGEGGHGQIRLALTQPVKASADGKSVEKDAAGNAIYDAEVAGAPNLFGFGSREWIKGLLDPKRISALEYGKPASPKDDNPDSWQREVLADYFGATKHREGEMAGWVKEHEELLKDTEKSDDAVDAIAAALSAQAQLRSQKDADAKDQELIQKGLTLIEQNCMDCHRMGGNGELGSAPDLTQYASYSWTLAFLTDPTHERFYRSENDRMPSFAQDLSQPTKHTVSIRELSLIVNWLRGEYYLASDKAPVLPTSEEEARHMAVMARLSAGGAVPAVIGAPAKAKSE
ncbi:MAG: cytochrome b N-terminal domain-containing protein [Planctomycetaceae bacterium]